jgi:hypothetical protein
MPSSENSSDDDVQGSTVFYPALDLLVVRRFLKRLKAGRRVEVVTVYRVSNLDPDPEIGSPAVRLTQADGKSYDLIRTAQYGWTCECPDFKRRREAKGLLCKHLKAALKTILAGTPAPNH